MDWPVTQAYIQAFAEAEKVPIRISRRINGFFGELYRMGASFPVEYEYNGSFKQCPLTPPQIESERLRAFSFHALTLDEKETLKQFGHRMKFPAKSAYLSRRWCSAYLKISVADSVIRNLEQIKADKKILLVSGERRGESVGRSGYNEMECHRTNATAKAHRLVHHWRAVIDYSLRDVWELIKRNNLTPHPCYTCG